MMRAIHQLILNFNHSEIWMCHVSSPNRIQQFHSQQISKKLKWTVAIWFWIQVLNTKFLKLTSATTYPWRKMKTLNQLIIVILKKLSSSFSLQIHFSFNKNQVEQMNENEASNTSKYIPDFVKLDQLFPGDTKSAWQYEDLE